MTSYDSRRTLKTAIITIIVLLIVGYSLFQSRNIIEGPQISIETPKNGAVLTDNLALVKGRAENTVSLTLDGKPIFTDENGYFSEHILLDPGYTVHKVTAKDKFGRVTETELELVFSGKEILPTETKRSTSTKSTGTATTTVASSTSAH